MLLFIQVKNAQHEPWNSKKLLQYIILGTVNTDLSRPYHKGVPPEKLFSTEKSVSCLLAIIDKLTVEDSGKVLAWDGSQIPF